MASISAPATGMRGQPADSEQIKSLEDDLAVQHAMLASFEDAAETPETAQEKTATKRKIMELKQQLSAARGKGYSPLSLETQSLLLLTDPLSLHSASQSSTGVVTNTTGKMDYLQCKSGPYRLPSRFYIGYFVQMLI